VAQAHVAVRDGTQIGRQGAGRGVADERQCAVLDEIGVHPVLRGASTYITIRHSIPGRQTSAAILLCHLLVSVQ
jgi:hypothetical protein